MAHTVRYEFKGLVVWARKNNLDDVFDTKRFFHKKLRSFRDLFDTRTEREGVTIAKNLLVRMGELMMADMIANNDIFIFPKQEFGYLRIGKLGRYMDTSNMEYSIEYDGENYGGLCILDTLVHRSLGSRMVRFKPVGPWMRKIYDLRAEGHRWT